MNMGKPLPALVVLAFFCQISGYAREKEEVPVSPPMAKPLVVSASVGRGTEIHLTIGGRIAEPMAVMIRRPPRLGTLGELERTGRNSAVVLYTPDPKAGPGADSFSFAAKSVDSPVSAAATVQIRLVEEPPLVQFPQELDFGPVFLGDTAEKFIPVRNAGGGTAFWQIKPPPPWRIGGSGSYKLAGGGESVLHLFFAPADEREFRDRIPMAPDPKSVLSVSGSGVAPVSWNKDGVVFTPKQRETGTIEWKVANQTSEERKITVEWPAVLKAPKETTIPPNSTSVLQIEVAGDAQLNYEGEAMAGSGNFRSRIPIRIFPAPAKLDVKPEKILKLDGLPKDGPLKGRFVVKNIGGSDAPLEIFAPPDSVVTPDPRSMVLRVGQEQTFEVQQESRKQDAGNFRIQSPACEPVDLSVESPASKPGGGPVPVERFLDIPKRSAPENLGAPEAVPSGVSPFEKVTVLSAELHEIVLTWKLPPSGASDFRIERRSITPGANGRVAVTWIPWQGGKISLGGGMATARLERLPANSLWTIRIVPVDERGNAGQPSPLLKIATKPLKHFPVPWWAWLAVAAALAAAAFKLWRRHQRGLLTKENERISRLELK